MRAKRQGITSDRNTLLFVGISLLSGFGSALMLLAAGVWVLELTGSSSLAALAGLFLFVPTLAGPALGAIVDRLPRRRLIIWTHLVTAATVLSLLAVRAEAQVWLIYAVMLGYGVSFVLVDAGEAALLPAALPPDALGNVNGLRVSAQEGVKLVAPLVGAGLFTWWGGHSVAVVTAGTLAVAAALYPLVRIRPPGPGTTPEPRAATAEPEAAGRSTGRIREGIRFLWSLPELRITVLIGSLTIAMSGLTTAAVYAVIIEDLHRPATFVGVLASAQGAGSLLGGLIVGRLLRTRGALAVGALGAVLFAVGTVARCIPWWPAAIGCSVLVGLGLPWTLVAAMTAIQTRTPEALLGRVSATASTLLFAPVAVATPVGAALILLDRRLPLLLAAALCLGAALLAVRPGPADRERNRLDGDRPDQPGRRSEPAVRETAVGSSQSAGGAGA
ncbi:MFS transporter [Micromonospora sp. NPDC092111]|uniref:MFS transporter n=1 Tax=Micromonospora sp. NPDC092111 TaxID=3364289 RepID=UPI003827F559